ncbi:NACHT domain-containing protein [Leptolyngbya sp. FACHB-711]|uniref:NACHT domain-containing protein n=1 Tax=unclassified Leptolyngbya TaxID=2650499 RepID=UPI001685CDDD|nr:NACHT domain-containing protein [Leptolyngbya sp. FACHB-711]MBD1853862.1 NACHT domain-containing protein [Cyanobacteria bacterium FACHB-502]MBD2024997.1 NACHT domain-containing protein [Leptolyngbya sp. FACHB-711]
METGDDNVTSRELSSQQDMNTSSENQYVYNQVQIGSGSHQSYVVNITTSDQQLIQQLIQQSGDSIRPRIEQALLAVVKEEIVARLKSSLHREVLINLDKQNQSRYVNPRRYEIQTGSVSTIQVSPEARTIDVFERADIAGRLLILGEPGSGKTTTLLDLAQDLLHKAEVDPNHAIPVLFSLSTWDTSHRVIQDWLIAELKSKYGVRADTAKKWIENQKLLPLLDGLDEARIEHQAACIQSINQWLQSKPSLSMAVCSRRKEYELQAHKLQLEGAIYLQDLTNQQIQDYLTLLEKSALWQILQAIPILLELVRKPLLLNITILVYQEIEIENRKNLTSTSDFLEYLLDSYVHRMLSRPLDTYLYTQKQTPSARQARQWLVWLAQQMAYRGLDEFSIERIDPSWLRTPSQKFSYRLILGIILGMIGGLIFGLIFGSLTEIVLGFFGCSVVGFTLGITNRISYSQDTETQRLPNGTIYELGRTAIITGTFSGLLTSLLLILQSLVTGFRIGTGIGLISALFFGGLVCLQHFVLRLILWKSGNSPWNYARFLNYCTERFILQRVGGSYHFIHRLMLDYFAAMPY